MESSRKALVATLLLLIPVGWPPGHCGEPPVERPLSVEYIERFMSDISGTWRGRAVLTPVGPLPYDISFARVEDGAVEGTADPGAAIHHWRFDKHAGSVHLRFLTTFRGNNEPIELQSHTLLGNVVVFRAREPSELEVQIGPSAQDTLIRVFLRDELHVEIQLYRPCNRSC